MTVEGQPGPLNPSTPKKVFASKKLIIKFILISIIYSEKCWGFMQIKVQGNNSQDKDVCEPEDFTVTMTKQEAGLGPRRPGRPGVVGQLRGRDLLPSLTLLRLSAQGPWLTFHCHPPPWSLVSGPGLNSCELHFAGGQKGSRERKGPSMAAGAASPQLLLALYPGQPHRCLWVPALPHLQSGPWS